MSETTQEEARWETWDRNRLLKLVEKLPSTIRIGISHHADSMWARRRSRHAAAVGRAA